MEPLKKVPNRTKKRAPANSLEARENQLINLAVELASKQLSEGTASAQVITHYLKLGTTREKLEKEKLARENLLLQAKTDALKSAAAAEELYLEAISAMKRYTGKETNEQVEEL